MVQKGLYKVYVYSVLVFAGVLPRRRTECLSGGHHLQRCAESVGGVLPDSVAPPVEANATLGQLQEEKDEQHAEGDSSVEANG